MKMNINMSSQKIIEIRITINKSNNCNSLEIIIILFFIITVLIRSYIVYVSNE